MIKYTYGMRLSSPGAAHQEVQRIQDDDAVRQRLVMHAVFVGRRLDDLSGIGVERAEEPVVDNDTDEHRNQNRRAVITLR